jgi:hypothetical protein
MAGLPEIVFGELARALQPLADAAAADSKSGDGVRDLARTVGYDIDAALTPALATQLGTDLGTIQDAIATLVDDPAGTANKIPQLVTAITSAKATLDGLDALAGAGADLGGRLFDYAVMTHVERRSPTLAALLSLIDIFHREPVAASGTLDAYVRREIRWDQIPKLLRPGEIFHDVYGWGDPSPNTNALLDRLSEVLFAFGLPASYVGSGASGMDGVLRLVWNVDFGALSTQIAIEGASNSGGSDPPGLALIPAGAVAVEHSVSLSAGWELGIVIRAGASSGYQLVVRPPAKVRIEAAGGGAISWALGAELGVSRTAAPGDARVLIFGSPDGTRFAARSVGFFARAQAEAAGGGDIGGEIRVVEGEIVASAAQGDGFLQTILPAEGITTHFDVTVGWSTARGAYIGGAALEITIGVHETLGPLTVESVTLGLRSGGSGELEVLGAVSAGIALGPVAGSVDRVGAIVAIKPGPPLDLDLRFKPPNGLGLVVDATVIKGGGYLSFDAEKGEYAGILELSIKDQIQVKAIGLLTTKLPDGKPGFSLLLIITAQFAPIQLSFGFTLTGIGGLIGINRTMLVDVLRIGLKARTLDSILFPENPVQNAPKIISDLKAVFPPVEARYVLAIMLELNWGTPALVTARIGVFIAIPSPVHIAILGQVKAALPEPDEAVVNINMDAIGVIEFEKKSFSVDATLYDSEIVGLALTGDMAMRLLWGDNANFALSVGGLNPRFTPPPAFPQLRRLELSMGNGNNPRISASTYFAITSNSVQVGAALEIRAEGGGFAVRGYLGFDALFIFSPFSFVAEMGGGVDLMRGSNTLMSINLNFTLSGPAPWHAHGRASIKLLFFKVTVRFDKEWGDPTPAPLPAADARLPLLAALAQSGSWSATLPPETERGASLGEAVAPAGIVLVHPLGRIEVRQKVVPLEQTITRFGSAPPKTYDHFEITSATLNGTSAAHPDVMDLFAPGQYLEMSDEDRIGKESFTRMISGASIGSDEVRAGSESPTEVRYSTYYVDDPVLPSRPGGLYKLRAETYRAQLRMGAGWLSPVRLSGDMRYSVPGVPGAVQVGELTHVVVRSEDLSATDVTPDGGTTQAAAEAALNAHLATHPEDRGRYHVMAKHEVRV